MQKILVIVLLSFRAYALAEEVAPISPELRRDFTLAQHYQKAILVEGFPVVGSQKVPDAAIQEAAHIVRSMLAGRADILRRLAKNRIRLGVMSVSERTCDLPEHADLTPAAYWNRRARGLGATRVRPCVSCAEENLLHNPGDPYGTESITVHEFAHAIHLMALNELDPTFDKRLQQTYAKALGDGLWKGKYAAENHAEYWAEAVQSWFGTNRENDAQHNHVNTRKELIEYDPALAALCQEVFGENEWRYLRTDDPSRTDDAHLKKLDHANLQPFAWTKEEIEAYEAVEKE